MSGGNGHTNEHLVGRTSCDVKSHVTGVGINETWCTSTGCEPPEGWSRGCGL